MRALLLLVRAAVICALLQIGLPTASRGHQPGGVVHRAFQFAEGAAPTIDGRLGDWALVGPDFALTTDDLTDLVEGAPVAAADFSVHLQLAWSSFTNSVYVGARVFDDVHQIDRPAGSAATRIFQDDAMEVFVDADHSGGQFADFAGLTPEEALEQNGAQASHFVIAGPPPDSDYFVSFSAAGWYALSSGPYTEAAYRHDAATGETTYELRLVLFDHVNMDAVFQSDEHTLQAGEVIGFNVEFSDFDAWSDLYEAKWSLSGAHNSFRFADRFSDLMLVPSEGIFPSVIESASWGRVKTALRN